MPDADATTDVAVVGAGLAGLCAALHLSDALEDAAGDLCDQAATMSR